MCCRKRIYWWVKLQHLTVFIHRGYCLIGEEPYRAIRLSYIPVVHGIFETDSARKGQIKKAVNTL